MSSMGLRPCLSACSLTQAASRATVSCARTICGLHTGYKEVEPAQRKQALL